MCVTLLNAALLGMAACSARAPERGEAAAPAGVSIVESPSPSDRERYCAWFGSERGDVLYFGEAPFWNAMRASGGDATAELREPGPQRVGRFDLARERMLEPLPTAAPTPRSGTWDVLAHPNGRVYFTTFFESGGFVDPRSGEARLLPAAGLGLNELALGPQGRVLATRYGPSTSGQGAVVVLDADGEPVAEHPIRAPRPGVFVAAKSLSFDPLRGEVWVNTDLIPEAGGATSHDARVIDLASGRERARFLAPELQFMRFEPDGRGHFVWLDGTRLELARIEPGAAAGPESGVRVLLDADFPVGLDFAQEVTADREGRVVVTRWSGVVHVVAADGLVRSVRLPRPDAHGFYYTAVARERRLCATWCGEAPTLVCAPMP